MTALTVPTSSAPAVSTPVELAKKLAAMAEELAQLDISSADRRELLAALDDAAVCLSGVATVIGTQVHQSALRDAPAGSRVRAEADRLYTEADGAASAFIRARRHLERAMEADEELVLEQAKAARGGDL